MYWPITEAHRVDFDQTGAWFLAIPTPTMLGHAWTSLGPRGTGFRVAVLEGNRMDRCGSCEGYSLIEDVGTTADRAVRGDHAGAGDGIRTRDINLGKVALYQLSYSRFWSDFFIVSPPSVFCQFAQSLAGFPRQFHTKMARRSGLLFFVVVALFSLGYEFVSNVLPPPLNCDILSLAGLTFSSRARR